ncbi:MAG: hypothetical protein ACPG21_04530 [Crocinitomicaceae bacterium]
MPKPLKRDSTLQPISRQHHKVLQCCFKVRQGLKKAIAPQRVLDYIYYFWEDYYTEHTRQQIDVLRPALTHRQLAAFTEKEDLLIGMYQRLQPMAENLVEFEKTLYDHVRWEERILFESIQEK